MKTQSNTNHTGFTKLDLCVVLAVLGLLAGLALPTLAREQSRDWRVFCLQRMGHLARAMAMYGMDNADYLPPSSDAGETTPGRVWCPGIAGVGGPQEYNPDILVDPKRSLLATYLNGNHTVFRCPLDPFVGPYQGTNSALIGARVPSARTVALNCAVGTNPNVAKAKQATDGAWLDGAHAHTFNKLFYTFGRNSDFVRPGPSRTFTFIEEDPYSLNDATLGCMGPLESRQYRMIDWPATLHETSAAIAFADGHSEFHRWVDNRTRVKNGNVSANLQPGNVDLEWLAEHTTATIRP